jgi:hypothetical protein
MQAFTRQDDPNAPRAPKETPREVVSAERPGTPPIRGVIVLTVKLFGETLKAPRTLAVWHVETAA